MSILDVAYSRYGRVKVGVWVTMVSFAVSCGSGVFLLTELILNPRIADLPYSASSAEVSGIIFPWLLAYAVLAIVLAGVLLQFGLVQPVMQQRRRLESSLANAAPGEKLEILARQRDAVNQQLDAVLDDNLALRDERQGLREQVELQRERQIALVLSSHERVLLLDQNGCAIAGSAAMANVLGVRGADIAGKPAKDLLRIYDASKERPQEYPLRTLVQDAIARASSIPVMQEVLLVSNSGKEQRLMVSLESVIAHGGRLCGALLRLDSMSDDADASGHAVARRGQADVTTGLPMREDFDRRLAELINIAKTQHVVHTLALITVDNLQKTYDDLGYWAGEELLWNVAQSVRDELGVSAEFFRITAMHFALIIPFEAPLGCERMAERLRLIIDEREFAWHERTYRSSLSIALSPIDDETPGNSAMMAVADSNLRTARVLGGNRVQLHATDELLAETQVIEKKLLSWLDSEGEQSQLQLQSVELEATGQAKSLIYTMLRVEMEDGFWIDPVAFLSSAQNSGLQHRIDIWLVGRALQAFGSISGVAEKFGPVVVPISAASTADEAFVDELMGLVAGSGVDPSKLVLAMDETACRSRMSPVTKFVSALETLGVGFALSNCRVSAIQDVVPRIKPQYVFLHPAIAQKVAEPITEMQLSYFAGAGKTYEFQQGYVTVPEAAQADALRKAGVHFMAKAKAGLGPLY